MERPAERARSPAAVARDLCQRLGVKAILLGSIAPLGAALRHRRSRRRRAGPATHRARAGAGGGEDRRARQRRRRRGADPRTARRVDRLDSALQRAGPERDDAVARSAEGVQPGRPDAHHDRRRPGDSVLRARARARPQLRARRGAPRRRSTRTSAISRRRRSTCSARSRAATRSASRSASSSSRTTTTSSRAGSTMWSAPTGCGSTRIRTTGSRTATCRRPISGSNSSTTRSRRRATAVRLAPTSVVPYQQLARTLLSLDRLDECKAILQDAVEQGLDSSVRPPAAVRPRVPRQRRRRHAGAPARRVGARRQLSRADRGGSRGIGVGTNRDEPHALRAGGHRRPNRAHQRLRRQPRRRAGARRRAAWATRTARTRNCDAALRISNGSDTTWTSSLAAAFSGRAAQAAQLAERYRQSAPPAPTSTEAFAPMLQAAIALANNDGRRALDALTGASPVRTVCRSVAAVPARPRARVAEAITRLRRCSSGTSSRNPGNQPTQPRAHARTTPAGRALRAQRRARGGAPGVRRVHRRRCETRTRAIRCSSPPRREAAALPAAAARRRRAR